MSDVEHGTHILFRQRPKDSSRKTLVWDVENKYGDGRIGVVYWYAAWRKYSFSPMDGTIFEQVCLREIADFCERKTVEHKSNATKAAGGEL